MDIAFQPIILMVTGEVIAYEILCRPEEGIANYFKTSTPKELWKKEKICLEAALKAIKMIDAPVHINITATSIPFFLMYDYRWKGAIEIVEWGFPLPDGFGALIRSLRRRGFDVWIDDLSPLIWPVFSSYSGITGYKISLSDLEYAKRIIYSDAPVIIEKIETEEDAVRAQKIGAIYGQGYLYGRPKLIGGEIKSESTS